MALFNKRPKQKDQEEYNWSNEHPLQFAGLAAISVFIMVLMFGLPLWRAAVDILSYF